MRCLLGATLLAWLCTLPVAGVRGQEEPMPQAWDYAPAMKEVAGRGTGRTGVVLHVGDSITHASPYGQWARAGQGKTTEDQAILAWMHTGADDDTDGWWLARADHPDGGRSYTACGGIRADELLAGGKNKMPPLRELLDQYRPQVVVLMLGTNDASAGRGVDVYLADMREAVDLILGRGVIVLLSTIPPHPDRPTLATSYNDALRSFARSRRLPLIDYEREVLRRRPDDWNGTLLQEDDVHPTADQGGASPTSAPTAEDLRNSGYLLRGWLSVRKIAEVKRTVLDGLAPPDAARATAAAPSAGVTGAVAAHAPAAPPLAFPGAEGFGARSRGGRGGKVVLVTNLNDSGPGSLRAAIEAEGPRTVIFRVGGTIELRSALRITEPFLTIAGQTAPGDGICIKDLPLSVRDTHDVTIRHLRIRPGDASGKEIDALTVFNCRDVIVDHCSVSWSTDETLSVTGDSGDVTVQWCLITESLHRSVHRKGTHGYGSLLNEIKDGGLSFHHNLYAHHSTRVPRPGAAAAPGLRLDWRNNVIYDWLTTPGYSREGPVQMNYVANSLQPGPSTTRSGGRIAFKAGAETRIFAEGNILAGFEAGTRDNWQMFRPAGEFDVRANRLPAPFAIPATTTHEARQAAELVLEQAGATRPRRDAVDRRVVGQVREGTGRLIDSPEEVGGWPVYRSATAPTDSDGDGMPDDWEQRHDLDPRHAGDNNRDDDGDGYTNLEESLNGTDPKAGE